MKRNGYPAAMAGMILVFVLGAGWQASGSSGQGLPEGMFAAQVFEDGMVLKKWLVTGPFPNPPLQEPAAEGVTRAGFGMDYLAPLGGEAAARIEEDTSVPYGGGAGDQATASTGRLEAGGGGQVDLAAHFEDSDGKVAYAYTELYLAKAQDAVFMVGSDDWAKIYVNGELVLSNWAGPGRACKPRSERFEVSLRQGANRILVKSDNATGPWGFIVEVFSKAGAEAMLAKMARRDAVTAAEVDVARYVFWEDAFPGVYWVAPSNLFGGKATPELAVRWFDGGREEVTAPDQTGRYAYYAEFPLPEGIMFRSAATCFKAEDGWVPWFAVPEIELDHIPSGMYSEAVWEEQQAFLNDWGRGQIMNSLYGQGPDGAMMLAGMSELEAQGRPGTQLNAPPTLDQDYHLALKRTILGVDETTYPALQRPRRKDGPAATVIHEGALEEAGMKPQTAENIRQVCQAWVDESDVPCTVMVARRGVIAFHEAFGQEAGTPITTEQRYPLASLTKTHAGIMLAQFVDQGLIAMEDPVGKYLPDFPVEGPRAITLRHCQAHTTGFTGHGEHGGMGNPWLDNALARELLWLEPGKSFLYNGMGFDLSGKVMEMVSGKSIFRLFQEHLFLPLGNEGVTIEDLGYGIRCRVADLARFGQLLANRGSYGELEFVSRETFEQQVMPKPLGEYFPDIQESDQGHVYNMGLHPWDERRADDPEERRIFSEQTIGHGAASGAVLRVDLENQLVVALCRPEPGPEYNEWLTRFLTAVGDSME